MFRRWRRNSPVYVGNVTKVVEQLKKDVELLKEKDKADDKVIDAMSAELTGLSSDMDNVEQSVSSLENSADNLENRLVSVEEETERLNSFIDGVFEAWGQC